MAFTFGQMVVSMRVVGRMGSSMGRGSTFYWMDHRSQVFGRKASELNC